MKKLFLLLILCLLPVGCIRAALPPTGVYLRPSFDSKPDQLIGAFFRDDLADNELDDNRAARTLCSKYLGYQEQEIPAGGTHEEVIGASSAIAGKLGATPLAYFSGKGGETVALRVQYEATKKLVVKMDEVELARCCSAQPSQCPRRYVREAIAGTGGLFMATDRSSEAGGNAMGTVHGVPVSGDVLYRNGLKWERTITFGGQYFAFTLGEFIVPERCFWKASPPSAQDGQYFTGVSELVPSEQLARDLAMKHARQQVVRYLGTYLAEKSQMDVRLQGAAGIVNSVMSDERKVEELSEGIASLVKDRDWCGPDAQPTVDGVKQKMYVLAFFPSSQQEEALRRQLVLMRQKLHLTDEQAASLEQAERIVSTSR